MATKKERLTDEELLAQFEGIDDDAGAVKPSPRPATGSQPSEADLFQELGITEKPRPSSRPHTPRLASTSASAVKSSPKRPGAATPPDTTRTSEEKAHLRKSGESSRSFHTSFTPATEREVEVEPETSAKAAPEAVQAQSSGGGWWGGIFATASAAVKQAEALAKEIQKNEEAQRWAEQVKGNVGALRGLGMISLPTRLGCSLTYPSFRRRTSLTRPPDLYQHPTHSCSPYFISRTSPNSHHSRHNRLPFPGPHHLPNLLPCHGSSRRRRPHGHSAGPRIIPTSRL